MVRQWSFCPRCRGEGCRECRGKGTVVALIPLKSLPAGGPNGRGVRTLYAKAQKDFIEYRARLSAAMKKRWQDPGYRARVSAGTKKRWQDPGYRARVSAGRKKQGQIRMKAGGTGERPGVNIQAEAG